MPLLERLRSRPKLWASAALVTGGLTAGAIIGSTTSATASTSSTSSTAAAASSGASTGTAQTPPAGTYRGLPKSGTVSAVGSASVTIDGTTYAVTSSSDIDKNGEATLKDLVAGDKVTFNTVSGASTPTIDKLHAGSEALDRPTGPPNGGGPGGSGYGTQPPAGAQPPSGSSSSSTSGPAA